MVGEFKDNCMKVNYAERIETPASELKIIVGQQRTITNRQKVQVFYFLKAGPCQSITDVFERLGVHTTTVQKWLKQYKEGGISELLKVSYSPGYPEQYHQRS